MRNTYIAVIIDESGSMSGQKYQTIEGYNAYVEEQKRNPENAFLTLTKFSDSRTVVFNARPLKDVGNLDGYDPAGGTSLFDAIGATIKEIEDSIAREKETPGVLCLIITDGQDNQSREFTKASIGELIKKKETEGNWNFVFLGADLDAFVGQDIGVRAANTMQISKGNIANVMRAAAVGTSHYRSQVSCNNLHSADFYASNRADYDPVDPIDPAQVNDLLTKVVKKDVK